VAALSLALVTVSRERIGVGTARRGAVIAQLGDKLDALRLLAHRDDRPTRVLRADRAVDGALVRKKRQQALLERVFFVVSDQLQLHNVLRYILYCRSRARVVASMWPGSTS
jgi:hypothetical protein